MSIGKFNTVGASDSSGRIDEARHAVIDVLIAAYVGGGGEPFAPSQFGFAKILDSIGERALDGTQPVYDIANQKLKILAAGGAEAGAISGTYRFHVWGF